MNRTVLLLFMICSVLLMSILAEPRHHHHHPHHYHHRPRPHPHPHRPTSRCPSFNPVSLPKKAKCSRPVDVFFVLDGSGSIGSCNFAKVRHFLAKQLAELDISRSAVRVGLMQFSTRNQLRIEFDLKRYGSRVAVVRAVERVRYMNGGATALGSALQKTRREIFSSNGRSGDRPGVPNVVVVLTDGKPFRDGANAIVEARLLKSKVERIIVVGFGKSVSNGGFVRGLERIAYPDGNVLQVEDIKDLDNILSPVRQDICKPPTGRCSATGDPHYKTFDGKRYNFMGKCQYTLAKHKYFKVLQKNEPCGNGKVTCTKTITVRVKGYTIIVNRGGFVTVNGRRVGGPYKRRGIQIIRKGREVTIKSDVGLTVGYNGVYNVFVEVAGKYKNTVSGLCGNFNGLPNDDFGRKPNAVAFGNSWKVRRSCPNAPGVRDPCKALGRRGKPTTARQCSRLKGSPFNKCKYVISPTEYVNNCEYDVCACKGNPQACLCQAYAAYIEDCSAKGITGINLRSFRVCRLPCSSAPCLNGGVCKNFGKKYKCFCRQGYGGCRCETKFRIRLRLRG